jgi:hypothetical protein
MIRKLAGFVVAGSFVCAGCVVGCSKQATATPDKTTSAAAPAAAAPADDPPPNIEPPDEPADPVIENDESAGVKDPPADDSKDDPEAEESDQGDYE